MVILLDLSAAFDTVGRLNQWLGILGTALDWFSSYLSSGPFAVAVGKGISSSSSIFTCGTPQGSVSGPT